MIFTSSEILKRGDGDSKENIRSTLEILIEILHLLIKEMTRRPFPASIDDAHVDHSARPCLFDLLHSRSDTLFGAVRSRGDELVLWDLEVEPGKGFGQRSGKEKKGVGFGESLGQRGTEAWSGTYDHRDSSFLHGRRGRTKM